MCLPQSPVPISLVSPVGQCQSLAVKIWPSAPHQLCIDILDVLLHLLAERILVLGAAVLEVTDGSQTQTNTDTETDTER